VRHQFQQIAVGRLAALADAFFGDVVATARHPGLHTRNMVLGVAQAAVPDQHIVGRRRGDELFHDGLAAQGGFEGERPARRDCRVQPPHPFRPRFRIGLILGPAQALYKLTSEGVRVEPGHAGLSQDMAAH